MAKEPHIRRREVALYADRARQMLVVAACNLDNAFYASAINRAYYAIFYAANAMLATQGLSRSKHSGVINAFRQHFVKPGFIEPEYSRIYGRVMDDRHFGDYAIEEMATADQTQEDLNDARRFVSRVEAYLTEEGWL